MRLKRLYHSLRLLLIHGGVKRAAYLKKHHILGGIGENCSWGPWLVPLYPEMIVLHNNVRVHKSVRILTHDMLNGFLSIRDPETDYGHRERLGCVEIMDNVYLSMNVTVMPNVRIGKDCIISAGSVVTSDIPENSLASGNPAKPTGRFDMFVALRKMGRAQTVKFKNQEIPMEVVAAEWEKFRKRHGD
mgnify:CR=1 FL=1